MKPHRILKSFPGNQTGNGPTEFFEKDTTAHLSKDLAAVAIAAGFAEPMPTKAEDRETKVTGPEETKIIAPEEEKTKKKKAK